MCRDETSRPVSAPENSAHGIFFICGIHIDVSYPLSNTTHIIIWMFERTHAYPSLDVVSLPREKRKASFATIIKQSKSRLHSFPSAIFAFSRVRAWALWFSLRECRLRFVKNKRKKTTKKRIKEEKERRKASFFYFIQARTLSRSSRYPRYAARRCWRKYKQVVELANCFSGRRYFSSSSLSRSLFFPFTVQRSKYKVVLVENNTMRKRLSMFSWLLLIPCFSLPSPARSIKHLC